MTKIFYYVSIYLFLYLNQKIMKTNINISDLQNVNQTQYDCQVFKVKIEGTRKKVQTIIHGHIDSNIEELFEKVLLGKATKREYRITRSIYRDVFGLKLKDFLFHKQQILGK